MLSLLIYSILFDCPLYSGIREQQAVLFASDQGNTRLFLKRNADQMSLVATISTCAFRLGSPMSHIWLLNPDCKYHYLTD